MTAATATRTRKPAARKTRAASDAPKFDPYQAITDQIVAQLEAGVAPWRKPWNAEFGMPRSLTTGKAYRGINPFLLSLSAGARGFTSPFWGTYDALLERGGQVRKGETGTLIMFWKSYPSKTEVDKKGQPKRIFVMRTYKVFNVEQADAVEGKTFRVPVIEARTERTPVAEVDAQLAPYLAQLAGISFGGDRACYSPGADTVMVPAIEDHEDVPEFYSTLAHELAHSTGHASRLNRPELTAFAHFGDDLYSSEELVAEMAAAMVLGLTGVGSPATLANSAAYLGHWAEVLRGDSRLVIQAAAKAQKAADLILGVTFEEQAAEEEAPAA